MSDNPLTKISPNTGTCYNKEYVHMLDGIYIQFKDTFFFSYIIQFILVTLLYFNVGSGQYWKILFYGSIAGLMGALLENVTLAFICQESQRNNPGRVYTFLLAEVFWILTEYSIPYLNLIKMKALSKNKKAVFIKSTIYVLFIPFAIMRFLIGYTRMQRGYLNDRSIELYHGFAFGVMAISEILCTSFILITVHKYNHRVTINPSLFLHYIQHSSYTILITVDICSIILSILYILVNLVIDNGVILTRNSVLPFHSFKSVYLLILAIDACLFKYGANVATASAHGTTDIGSKNTGISESYKAGIFKSSIVNVTSNSMSNFSTNDQVTTPQSPEASQSVYNNYVQLC